MVQELTVVGKGVPRKGLADKLTGAAQYAADIKLPGMLHGKVLRSPHPHAEIISVDASAAASLPGVHATLTPFDAPEGRVAADLAILDTRVRFVGDEVAAVAAEDNATAAEALDLISVEYRTLPFVLNPEEALKLGAPQVQEGGTSTTGGATVVERGNVEEGLAQADLVFEETFRTPGHAPAALESRAALAQWEGDHLTVWKSSRGVHGDRATLARALGIPPENVRVIGPFLGAGYGGKDETRTAALAAILAQRAGRPVRIDFDHKEEFVAGRTRHAAITRLKVGVKRDGTVTAIDCHTIMDTGAYLSSGPTVLRRSGQATLYLYTCPNVRFQGKLAYTNRPAAGSYRALGAPQGHFALESLMDRVAEELGIDPLDFRLKNHVRLEGQPGQRVTPPGEIVDAQPSEGGIPFSSNGLEECILKGAEAIGWRASHQPPNSSAGPRKRGMGMSLLLYRGGVGNESAAEIRVKRDGAIELVCGVMDVGEGAATALAQIAAESLGARYDDIRPVLGDTGITPRAPTTSGSSVTFSSGTAVVEAASQLKEKLLELASSAMEVPQEGLATGDGLVYVQDDPSRSMSLADVVRTTGEEMVTASATITPGSPDYIVNSFGAQFAEVEVDTDTGQVKVLRFVAAHDSGRIINPKTALNQVEGGVTQMMGYALSEDLLSDETTGVTLNSSFLEHKVPTILEMPDIQVIFADVVDPVGPLGAKALGELPCIGVAPAIANAIYNAIGVRFNRIPITPDRVLEALSARPQGG